MSNSLWSQVEGITDYLGVYPFPRDLLSNFFFSFTISTVRLAMNMEQRKETYPISEHLLNLTIDGAKTKNKKAKTIFFYISEIYTE